MSGMTNDGNIKLSVVIPTYNRADILKETLQRLSSLPDLNFEVIVIDNGSTDDTPLLRGKFPKVRWVVQTENLGAAARNIGVDLAYGDVVLMLDDDSWPESGVIDSLVRAFEIDPTLGAVACRVRLANPPNRHDAGGVPGVIFNCGGAVRRELFQRVGGYPADFDYYVEEYDLCCKIWAAGYTVRTAGELVVYHHRSSINRDANRMLERLVRNNIVLWSKYASPSRRDALIDADVERYRRIAQKLDAIQGFEKGLREGVERARDLNSDAILSNEFLDSLLGIEDARQLLRRWADKHGEKSVAIWSRGKGCELLLEAILGVGIRPVAVYDSPHSSDEIRWHGLALRNDKSQSIDDADAIVIGTLSPGVAADIEDELRARFPNKPILNLVP